MQTRQYLEQACMHERHANTYVHRNHRPRQANRREVMTGCMLHIGRDIPKPGHLSPAIAEAPVGKRARVRKDKHDTVGKNKSPMPSRNRHHRKRRKPIEGRRLQWKAALVNMPPAYLNCALVHCTKTTHPTFILASEQET